MNQSSNYPVLSSPSQIGEMKLKNKMVMAAMGSNFAGTDGHTTEQLTAYYEERAKGGIGYLSQQRSVFDMTTYENLLGICQICIKGEENQIKLTCLYLNVSFKFVKNFNKLNN